MASHQEARFGTISNTRPPNPSSTQPNRHCSFTTIAICWAQVLNCDLLKFLGSNLLLRQQADCNINEAQHTVVNNRDQWQPTSQHLVYRSNLICTFIS